MMILVTIVCYFAILLLIARITGRKGGSNAAFFKGENQSPWYIVAFGMIGASISGVTFVSVPGMVKAMDMTYMQTVFGFFFGYLAVAHILLPLYYKLNLTSIYTYLDTRIGKRAYRTGASGDTDLWKGDCPEPDSAGGWDGSEADHFPLLYA